MAKKITTQDKLNEFEELQTLIKDVLDLKKKLDDGGDWTNATREEAQFFLDSVKELNNRAEKYVSKVKSEGMNFLTEIEKELPKEKTLWDGFKEELAPLKKLGDSVAKFFGQDSMADVADTLNVFWGNQMVIPEQPISEKYGEKVQELLGIVSEMKDKLQDKEIELNEELTDIESNFY